MIRPTDHPEATDNASDVRPAQAFQPDDLNNLFDGAGDEEDPLAAMRDNPDYAELIRELEYIAAQARALFPPAAEVPRDVVWDKIASQLPTKLDS